MQAKWQRVLRGVACGVCVVLVVIVLTGCGVDQPCPVDANGQPVDEFCLDFDRLARVDTSPDFMVFLFYLNRDYWSEGFPWPYDYDGDGDVNLRDFAAWQHHPEWFE
jgi:hypothetical protein